MNAVEDELDLDSKHITWKSDRYLEEEFENEIGLDIAKLYIEEQKKETNTKEEAPPCLDPKQNLE